MKTIAYVTGTRADYGLMRNTLRLISKNPKLKLRIIATGMHLMPEFGSTINEIKKDGFKIDVVDAVFRNDDRRSMAEFVGKVVSGMVRKLSDIRPDAVLLLGDRGEMLAAAVACLYMNVPVVHVHGGEVTRTVDEVARHSITKLSSYHIAATKESAERIRKMGEEPSRIMVFGAPGLDDIRLLHDKKKTADMFCLDLKKPIIVVVQHPERAESAAKDMEETMAAVDSLRFQTVIIYPNADAGGRAMIKVIKKSKSDMISTYKNLPRKDFLSLLNIADVLVGNSSSGMIESALLRLPVVNIGERQKGRQRAGNVIDAKPARKDIIRAVRKAMRAKLTYKSPYGDGKAGERIVKFLLSADFSRKALKSMTY